MTQRNTTMTYEQLKQSHDEWKQTAKDNFSSYKYEKVRADAADKTIRELVEIIEYEADLADLRSAEMHARELRAMVATLYPDTPAPTPMIKQPDTARPIDDWHEDFGDVLWWEFPVCEPPYYGTPLDSEWPDYHTHWTPIVIPAAPSPKEGDTLD